MPNSNSFAVGKKNRAKTLQGIPFKPRGLKGRVRSVNNESVGDIVDAAMNILAAGHAVLACGERVQSGRSMKQEPAEVI